MRRFLPTVVRLALRVGNTATADAALAASSGDTAKWCRGLIERDAEAVLLAVKHFGEAGRHVEQALAAEDAAVLLVAENKASAS